MGRGAIRGLQDQTRAEEGRCVSTLMSFTQHDSTFVLRDTYRHTLAPGIYTSLRERVAFRELILIGELRAFSATAASLHSERRIPSALESGRLQASHPCHTGAQ